MYTYNYIIYIRYCNSTIIFMIICMALRVESFYVHWLFAFKIIALLFDFCDLSITAMYFRLNLLFTWCEYKYDS